MRAADQQGFGSMTDAFDDKYRELWKNTASGFPQLSCRTNIFVRWSNERRIEGFRKELVKNMRHMPADAAKRYLLNEKVQGMVSELESSIAGYDRHLIDWFADRGFAGITEKFFEEAKRFDPDVELPDIYQAMRNVWIMNSIQVLLGSRVVLTPAVFAYSMLYPYSDNYLDDPYISIRDKRAFSGRFHDRLKGEDIEPVNDLEALIFRLVGRIEGMFPRAGYPGVYSSLLAIHAAQTRGLQVQNADAGSSPEEILGVTVYKGGTSVLADGFLVKPSLTLREADFLYGFGFLLQLIDDLQDVAEDFAKNHCTLFSMAAPEAHLDSLTSRLFRFADAVFSDGEVFRTDQAAELRRIMRFSCEMMVMEAVSQNRELFSEGYLRRLEKHSLVRMAYFPKVKRSLSEQYPDRVISNIVAALAC